MCELAHTTFICLPSQLLRPAPVIPISLTQQVGGNRIAIDCLPIVAAILSQAVEPIATGAATLVTADAQHIELAG